MRAIVMLEKQIGNSLFPSQLTIVDNGIYSFLVFFSFVIEQHETKAVTNARK